ncbi:30S ribosome-binding factor RbfA [Alkalibacter saccharofermentans]|uniref:Ribosome-binding factor A n=1 Tax=Alkalibacter saccharofermentans DSM 14828 TaxID=1120975 RepID=A0A1M4S6L0_9FIRM|nr:30S ribosome-binding factor RbfA [Alkalibacter saccharofermentans]SHE27849.1 ribosome-binding factor A [Alkalibacter saccharofermentans DSM 14828]
MAKNRINKINETIKQELSSLIRKNIKDPRLTELISVMKVDTTGDLRYAKVYISIFDTDEKKAQAIDILNKAAGFLRKNVGKTLKTHYTPELIFVLDDSIEYGAHIDEVIRKLHKDSQE